MKAHCKEGVPCTVDDCFYCPNIPRRKVGVTTEHDVVLQRFVGEMLNNMVPLEPEFSKVVDDHFWELV